MYIRHNQQCIIHMSYLKWLICSVVSGSMAIRVSISLVSFVTTPWCNPLTVFNQSKFLLMLALDLYSMNEAKNKSTIYSPI